MAAQLICCHCVIPRTSREKSLSCWARGVSSILEESSVPSHRLWDLFWYLEELFTPSGLSVCNRGSAVSCALSWRWSTGLLDVCAGQPVRIVLDLCFVFWSSSPFSTEWHQVASLAYLHSISDSAILSWPQHSAFPCCHTSYSFSVPPFFAVPRGNCFQAAGLNSIFLWSGMNYISRLNVLGLSQQEWWTATCYSAIKTGLYNFSISRVIFTADEKL